jgi:hypothetical protein
MSSGNWERWLPAFAFWVFVGVGIEIVAILREYRENRAAWRRGTIRSSEKPATPKLIWELMGATLVTVGVGLEFWGGAAIAKINGDLRSLNAKLRHDSGELVALVTQQAGEAALSAKIARHEADEARASAKTAGKLAISAKSDARSAHREVTETERQTRATAAQLEDEHKKRMELEKSLAPRTIVLTGLVTPQRHIHTTDVLKKFSGLRVSIETISDWEARRAGKNLEKAFHAADWSAASTVTDKTDIPDGVTVYTYDPSDWWKPENRGKYDFDAIRKSSDAAREVIAFIQANDWQAERGYDTAIENGLDVNELLIKVGFKPTPYFDTFPLNLINANRWNPYQKRAEEIRNEIKKVLDEIKRADEDMRRRKSDK